MRKKIVQYEISMRSGGRINAPSRASFLSVRNVGDQVFVSALENPPPPAGHQDYTSMPMSWVMTVASGGDLIDDGSEHVGSFVHEGQSFHVFAKRSEA